MLKLRTKFHSLLILLVTAVLVVFFGLKVKGQTRNYITGRKTGNYFGGGAAISLGTGSATVTTPMSAHSTTNFAGLGSTFRFFYGDNTILTASTTIPTKLRAAQDLGLLGALGAGSDVYLQVRNTSNNLISSGVTTYFTLKEKPTLSGISVAVGGLLGVVETQNIKGRGYSGAGDYVLNTANTAAGASSNHNENIGTAAGTVAGTRTRVILDKNGEWYVAVTPDANYNSIRLEVALPSDLRVADVARVLETNVYNAFTVSGATCNTLPLFTNAGEATGITIDAGAVVGGLQLSQLIANPEYAINGVTNQYSSFSSGLASVGVASTVSQSFYYDHSATANDGLHLKLGMSNSLIGLSLAQLNGITFYAYSGTSETPVYTKGLGDLATLLGLDLLNLINLGSSHKEIELSFKPGVTFDRFKIEFNKGLLGVGVIGDALRVYDVSLAPSSPTITVQPTTTGSTNICEGNSANFSVTATVPAGGTISNYQWQYYDGSAWVNTGTNSNIHSTGATTLSMNNRLYRVLVTGGNATCPQTVVSNPVLLTVKALPSAGTITGNSAVCVSKTITLTNATTGGVWTSSNTSIATVSTGVVTGIAAGTVTITYTVTDPVTSCVNSTTKSITVNPLPTASITGSTAVCQNSASPLITFTGGNGTAPYTFSYKIGTGSTQTISTTSGNSVSVSAATTTPGTFTYTLLGVQDSSSTTCSQTQNGTATITINPKPAHPITIISSN